MSVGSRVSSWFGRGASTAPWYTFLLPLPYWAWVVFSRFMHMLRWDQIVMAVAATALTLSSARMRRLFLALVPLSAVAFLYDGMRLVRRLGLAPNTVHVCDFRALEMRWFGMSTGGVRGTVHEFFQAHASPSLDLIAAVPYGIFIYVVLGFAVYLLRRDFVAQQRFAWGFLALNLAGFATYFSYPVAPPWYFHQFGCSVHLDALPSAGPNLLRVDDMLGVGYFRSFYGRSSDVFGALPSLHVAYPLLMILVGWPLHRRVGRTLLVMFYLWMCFAAMYLDHHWILDIVAGSTYALVTAWLMKRLIRPARRVALGEIAGPTPLPSPLGRLPGREMGPDRVRAFVRFAIRRGPILWLAASVLAVPAFQRTLSLYVHLKSDLEELLPRRAPSVVALDEYRARMPASRYLGIIVDVGSPEHLAQGEAFVDALAERIAKYPSDLVAGVRTGVSEEREFARAHAALFVDMADLTDLRRRIEARRDYEIAHRLDLDLEDQPPPVLDLADLEHKYGDRVDALDKFPGGRFSSATEHATLLLVAVPGFSTGTDTGERLLSRVHHDIADLGGTEHFAPAMRVGFTGDIAITVEELAALRSDLVAALFIVIVLVLGCIWAFYRWWPSIPILLLPLAMATVYGFALVTLPPIRLTALNSNTAFLGSVVIGNGVNFGIILLARYREERALGYGVEDALVTAIRTTRVATLVAASAAAVSYGSLLFTQFQGFHQFGIIGGTGMMLCWGSAYLLTPALVSWFDKAPRKRAVQTRETEVARLSSQGTGRWETALSSLVVRRARWVAIAAGVVTVLSLIRVAHFDRSFIESDFSRLRRGDLPQSGERYWGRRMDALLGRYLTPLVVLTDSAEESREVARRLKAALRRPPLEGLLDSVRWKGDLVPEDQEAKLDEVRKIREILTPRVMQTLSEAQRKRVDQFFSSAKLEPITASDLPASMLVGMREKNGDLDRSVLVFPRPSRQTWLGGPIEALTRELRGAASDVGRDWGLPPARVAGSIPLSNDIIHSIVSDGPIAAAAALVGVILIVLAIFRVTAASALIIGSLLVGVVWLAASVMTLGVKVNFANFVAFPITFGIGVDYAVNMMARYRQEGGRVEGAISATAGAVALASATTIIGYGSLLFARNRGLFSFGEVAVLGEIACLVSAVIVLPALVALMTATANSGRRRREAHSLPFDDEQSSVRP